MKNKILIDEILKMHPGELCVVGEIKILTGPIFNIYAKYENGHIEISDNCQVINYITDVAGVDTERFHMLKKEIHRVIGYFGCYLEDNAIKVVFSGGNWLECILIGVGL